MGERTGPGVGQERILSADKGPLTALERRTLRTRATTINAIDVTRHTFSTRTTGYATSPHSEHTARSKLQASNRRTVVPNPADRTAHQPPRGLHAANLSPKTRNRFSTVGNNPKRATHAGAGRHVDATRLRHGGF